jgi:hypothetical protein
MKSPLWRTEKRLSMRSVDENGDDESAILTCPSIPPSR